MIRRLLKQFADAKLQLQVATLESELDKTERQLSIAETENKSLSAVIARDRSRIQAEVAAYKRQRAESEGIQNDQSVL